MTVPARTPAYRGNISCRDLQQTKFAGQQISMRGDSALSSCMGRASVRPMLTRRVRADHPGLRVKTGQSHTTGPAPDRRLLVVSRRAGLITKCSKSAIQFQRRMECSRWATESAECAVRRRWSGSGLAGERQPQDCAGRRLPALCAKLTGTRSVQESVDAFPPSAHLRQVAGDVQLRLRQQFVQPPRRGLRVARVACLGENQHGWASADTASGSG